MKLTQPVAAAYGVFRHGTTAGLRLAATGSLLFGIIATLVILSACTPSSTVRPASTAPSPSSAAEPVGSNAAAQSSPYYVGVDGLSLFPEPQPQNKTATLPLHQKVVRTRLERGWAFVTVEGSGLQGWVDNAKLIWRLPTTGKAIDEKDSPIARSEAPSTPAASEPANTSPTHPTDRALSPSALDPY